MYKENNVQTIITATMVLVLLFAGQASASFDACFFGCLARCLLFKGRKMTCVLNCFQNCLFDRRPILGLGFDRCKHSCAIDQCTRFITDDFKFEDVDKVVSCVSECDNQIADQCSLLDRTISSPNGAPSP
ncbi:hypothetical protein OROHE_003802 [Orobanche hederae]